MMNNQISRSKMHKKCTNYSNMKNLMTLKLKNKLKIDKKLITHKLQYEGINLSGILYV